MLPIFRKYQVYIFKCTNEPVFWLLLSSNYLFLISSLIIYFIITINMYTQVWSKYLPVIKILLKRSVNQNDQTLEMNRIDFERAGSGRKAGYKFNIDFINGRIDNVLSSSPLAHDLAQLMMQDDSLKEIISKNDFQLVFNTKFQLTIKCKTAENDTSLQ